MADIKPTIEQLKSKEAALACAESDPAFVIDKIQEWKKSDFARELGWKAIESAHGKGKPENAKCIDRTMYLLYDFLKSGALKPNDEEDRKDIVEKVFGTVKHAVANEQGAVGVAKFFNALYGNDDAIIKKFLQRLDLNQQYDVLTHGREELSTKNYGLLLDEFRKTVKKESKNLADVILANEVKDRAVVFIEAAVTTRKFTEIWHDIPESKRDDVIKLCVENAADPALKINSAIALADTLCAMKDKDALQRFEKALKEKYESANTSPDEKLRLGLVCRYYAENANAGLTPENNVFFLGIKENERLALKTTPNIAASELYDDNKQSYQLYRFYADEDGVASFDSFKAHYTGKEPWKVDDKVSYLHVHATGADGREINIFANKPKSETGVDDIIAKVKDMQGSDKPKFQIICHRGHSGETAEATIAHITSDTKLVLMGSCRGYYNTDDIMQKSPSAQIISCKVTGTKSVNDPLFKDLNDSLLSQEQINWEELWNSGRVKDSRMSDYVRPDKNSASIITEAWNRLSSDESAAKDKQASVSGSVKPEMLIATIKPDTSRVV